MRPPVRPGRLDVEFSKNGREVLVRGRAEVDVTVPCVVTLDPLPFKLEPEILLLLTRGREEAAGRVRQGKAGPRRPKEKQGAKPAGKKGKRSKGLVRGARAQRRVKQRRTPSPATKSSHGSVPP